MYVYVHSYTQWTKLERIKFSHIWNKMLYSSSKYSLPFTALVSSWLWLLNLMISPDNTTSHHGAAAMTCRKNSYFLHDGRPLNLHAARTIKNPLLGAFLLGNSKTSASRHFCSPSQEPLPLHGHFCSASQELLPQGISARRVRSSFL